MARNLKEAFSAAGIAPPQPQPKAKAKAKAKPAPKKAAPAQPNLELQRILAEGLLTGSNVGISGHAVKRYRQRFEPDLDFREAKRALYMRMHRGVYSAERPPWLVHVSANSEKIENVGYIILDDEIALPVRNSVAPQLPGRFPPQPFTVVTCLFRPQL